jgi:NhaA family Na+:H+ antiporter
MAATGLALAWANSPWSSTYFHLWEANVTIGLTSNPITTSLHHWINDGLMTLFFLLVGLEIKRELLVGELSNVRQAFMPIAAAVGGMIVPALMYAAFNVGGNGSDGWGIPMATDIAFSLGVLTLLGSRVPPSLKIFLAALAIVDDMGAVFVIALFYTSSIDATALAIAGALTFALFAMNRLRIRSLTPFLLVGIALWTALLSSGIHATIAGIILALAIPAKTRINAAEFSSAARRYLDDFDRAETGDLLVLTSSGQQEALSGLQVAATQVHVPLLRLEHGLHGIVGYVIMPIFAFANAGVVLDGAGTLLVDRVALGVVAGLLIGKPLGLTLFSWMAVKAGWAELPAGATWRAIFGVSCLAGIGFTMSLFVGSLAFGDSPLFDAAKVGILLASAVAGIVGWRVLSSNESSSRHRSV